MECSFLLTRRFLWHLLVDAEEAVAVLQQIQSFFMSMCYMLKSPNHTVQAPIRAHSVLHTGWTRRADARGSANKILARPFQLLPVLDTIVMNTSANANEVHMNTLWVAHLLLLPRVR